MHCLLLLDACAFPLLSIPEYNLACTKKVPWAGMICKCTAILIAYFCPMKAIPVAFLPREGGLDNRAMYFSILCDTFVQNTRRNKKKGGKKKESLMLAHQTYINSQDICILIHRIRALLAVSAVRAKHLDMQARNFNAPRRAIVQKAITPSVRIFQRVHLRPHRPHFRLRTRIGRTFARAPAR